MERRVVVFSKYVLVSVFTSVAVLSAIPHFLPPVHAQYPPTHPCAYNRGCISCPPGQTFVESYLGCTCSCGENDSSCCNQPRVGSSCVVLSSCGVGCHPSTCYNVPNIPECYPYNIDGIASHDDCNMGGNLVCGPCPTGPGGTPLPTLTPTCAATSNATCSSPDGKQITTIWNVTDVNFIINQIRGRFNQGPNYGDWPTGPGDQSIPWGTAISGTQVTDVESNTDYSTSVGVFKNPIDATGNNYICKSASAIINCPTPIPIPGTIKVRAVDLSSITNPTCGNANSASAATFSAPITYTVSGLGPQTVSGGSFATWSNVAPDVSYTVDNPTISGYTPLFPCWTTDVPVSRGAGPARTLLDGQTLTWNIGYTPIGPWLQAGGGGDVYAWGAIQSSIPPHAPAYPLCVSGARGTPGIVTYGGSSTNVGEGIVSSAPYGWLVNERYAQTDFYQLFYHRFGSPTTSDFPSGTTIS